MAPDGSVAHQPHCRDVQDGEYVMCAGSCGQVSRYDRQFEDSLGYCVSCNPFVTEPIRLPRVVGQLVDRLVRKLFR